MASYGCSFIFLITKAMKAVIGLKMPLSDETYSNEICKWIVNTKRKHKKNVMVFGMTESERIKQNCIFDTEYM